MSSGKVDLIRRTIIYYCKPELDTNHPYRECHPTLFFQVTKGICQKIVGTFANTTQSPFTTARTRDSWSAVVDENRVSTCAFALLSGGRFCTAVSPTQSRWIYCNILQQCTNPVTYLGRLQQWHLQLINTYSGSGQGRYSDKALRNWKWQWP